MQKRMMSIEGNKIYINSSSLSIIQQCLRKTDYYLNKNLRGESENIALSYGKAIHIALEAYYSDEIKSEEYMTSAFTSHADKLKELPKEDKHSIDNAVELLKLYHKIYKDDSWIIYKDYVEKDFEFNLEIKVNNLEVWLFGTIDTIMQNKQTGELAIFDHKTTSMIGDDFIKKVKPNHQYSFYVAGVRQAFKLDISSVYQNGLQKKNVFGKRGRLDNPQLCRIKTSRDEYDLEDLQNTIHFEVQRYLVAKEVNYWPMSTGFQCAGFSPCQYHEICSSKSDFKEKLIKEIYNKEKNNET